MKQKISISLEKETIKKLEGMLKDLSFRNKSHVIEIALNKFMDNRK